MADTTTPTPTPEAAPAVTDQAAAPVAAPKRKKMKPAVPFGHVHILATFNNTIITVTDTNGGALTFSSAGACGFRGSKKGTAYAAQVAAEKAYEDPELTLTQLARMLKSNATIVSKVINQGFQLNFNDFINHHRVEAVKQKLQA